MMSDLYFNEESDYSEENTCDNKVFHSTILQSADLLHIRIGNLNWCKCRHCKNETGEIHCLSFRGVDAMLIASAKIL